MPMHKPHCLKCKAILSNQQAVDGGDSKPHDGDVAICLECGEAMLFQAPFPDHERLERREQTRL